MNTYIVTYKHQIKNKEHDPKNKVTNKCTASNVCTDSTGEHHSFLAEGITTLELKERLTQAGMHITRIELATMVRKLHH